MIDLFSDYSTAKVFYCENADRLFIFHQATFLMLPSLEREDGKRMILLHQDHVWEWCGLPNDDRYKLEYIGDL